MGRPSIICVFVFSVLFSCQNKEDIIFFDDFNAESLNTKYWNYEQGDGCPNLCGWGNNERQIYTKENIELRDGNLIIEATKGGGASERRPSGSYGESVKRCFLHVFVPLILYGMVVFHGRFYGCMTSTQFSVTQAYT